jgi:hypothetical protein
MENINLKAARAKETLEHNFLEAIGALSTSSSAATNCLKIK